MLAAVEEKTRRGEDVRLCREERRRVAARLYFLAIVPWKGRDQSVPTPSTEVRLCETHWGVLLKGRKAKASEADQHNSPVESSELTVLSPSPRTAPA